MREALTVVGVLLILGFAALFAAPLYVDWNAWRPTIEARLSERLGVPVTIEGPIDARILPQPWLLIRRVRIGDAKAATQVTIDTVESDINLQAFIRGDVELSDLTLDGPKVTVTTDAQGHIGALTAMVPASNFSIDSFEIQNGTIHYVDGLNGEDVTVGSIHLVGDAGSLTGPIKGEGGALLNGVPYLVKLSAGAVKDGAATVNASFVPADEPVTLDFSGTLGLKDGRPLFDGTGTLTRPPLNTHGDRAPPEEPWTIAAQMKLTPSSLLADKVDIQIGPDERAVKLTGSGSAVLGKDARIDAALSATQLDLDRLAGLPADKREPPLVVLARIREAFPPISVTPVPAHVTLAVQGVSLSADLLQNVRADLASTPQGLRVNNLDAALPGDASLSLVGDVAQGGSAQGSDDANFEGTVDLETKQAASLVAWLQGAERTSRPNVARQLALTGAVVAGRDAVRFSKLKLAIDDASVEGNLGWTRVTPNTNVGRIDADLTARSLDLDTLPSAASLLPGGSFAAADIRLSARSLTYGGVVAKSANGHVKVSGDAIDLEDVTIDDLGGASIIANGHIDSLGTAPRGEIQATVDGRDLTGLATALKSSSLPQPVLDGFSARAAALSPASADIALSFGETRRVTVDGKFGGSAVSASLDLQGPNDKLSVAGELKLDSRNVVALLRQLGLTPLPMDVPGGASFEASVDGPLDGAPQWTGAFKGAGIALAGSGKITNALARPSIDGRLTLTATNLLVSSTLFGIGLPGVLPGDGAQIDTAFRTSGGRIIFDDAAGVAMEAPFTGTLTVDPGSPARIDGSLAFETLPADRFGSLLAGVDLDGIGKGVPGEALWPADPFTTSTLDGIVGSLAISADKLTFSSRLPAATAAKATLALDPGVTTLDGLSAQIAGGTLSGTLRFSRTGPEAALTGHIGLGGIALATPGLSGRLDGALDLQGTGRTPAALAAALTGGGTLAVHDPKIAGLSEAAFGAVATAVDSGIPADTAHVQPLLEQALAKGPIAPGDLAGPIALAGGVVNLATVTGRGQTTGLSLTGSLDLSTLAVKSDIILTPPTPADGFGGPPPGIAVSADGPVSSVTRKINGSALVAWLTVRSAEREAKKLEALEAETQAREKAMEDQRRAEAERMQHNIDAQKAAEAAKDQARNPKPLPTAPDQSDVAKPNATGPDLTKPDLTKPDLTKPDSLQPNPVKPALPVTPQGSAPVQSAPPSPTVPTDSSTPDGSTQNLPVMPDLSATTGVPPLGPPVSIPPLPKVKSVPAH